MRPHGVTQVYAAVMTQEVFLYNVSIAGNTARQNGGSVRQAFD